jgi:quercetin dioxygenase-like cupin family protein
MKLRVLIVAVAAALVAVPGAGTAGAQIPGVTAEELARGRMDYAEAVAGPAEVVTARVTLQPGSSIGWHTHPGPVTFVVTAGELAWYGHDGCRNPYPAGSAGIVEPGEAHNEGNEGAQAVELLATYLVPAGAPLPSSAEAPTAVCAH